MMVFRNDVGSSQAMLIFRLVHRHVQLGPEPIRQKVLQERMGGILWKAFLSRFCYNQRSWFSKTWQLCQHIHVHFIKESSHGNSGKCDGVPHQTFWRYCHNSKKMRSSTAFPVCPMHGYVPSLDQGIPGDRKAKPRQAKNA